ncbi:MAG: very short patch repair endonuclease [Melioribacteraceae bacterium]
MDTGTNSSRMSKIKSKNTKLELFFEKLLKSKRIRYRKHYDITGKPDFVLVKRRVAIFCDSCFWHGYKNMSTSIHNFRNNKEYWEDRIKKNIQRDRVVNKALKQEGWSVIRFWDFEIYNESEKCIEKIADITSKSD